MDLRTKNYQLKDYSTKKAPDLSEALPKVVPPGLEPGTAPCYVGARGRPP